MVSHSTIEPLYYLLPLAGFIVGLFGTMLGGGGGFFFLPLLTIVYGVAPQNAVITSLVATLPICLLGSFMHYREGNLNYKVAGLFIYTGVTGALIGTSITHYIHPEWLKTAFGAYLLIIAINMIRANSGKASAPQAAKLNKRHSLKSSALGLMAGMITGTFGTSGTAPVLAGLLNIRIPLKQVIGTSLLIILINTAVATGAHLHYQTIDLTLVGFLTTGSALGAVTGPLFLKQVRLEKRERNTRYIYALVIAALGFLMITN